MTLLDLLSIVRVFNDDDLNSLKNLSTIIPVLVVKNRWLSAIRSDQPEFPMKNAWWACQIFGSHANYTLYIYAWWFECWHDKLILLF